MGEQIVLAHLHGVSAAQMTLRLGPLPLAKPAVGTPSPSKSGQWEAQAWQCHEHLWVQHCGGDATQDAAASQFGEASPAKPEHEPEKGAWW